jgi:hypothetical protein
MGHRYAGILGLVAFATVVARGTIHAASAEAVFTQAVIALFAFAAAGYILGRIAEQTLGDALKAHFEIERAKLSQAPNTPANNTQTIV